MVIGGFQRVSLSDFPGVICSIVFTRGCGFRCPYCHNPELVEPSRFGAVVLESDVKEFLRSRTGRVDGVVVTGGEPTIQPDLPRFLSEIKTMGLKVKLDTNGSNPGLLRSIISERLVDFIAMDVKAPLALYRRVVRVPVDVDDVQTSVDLVRGCGLPHEFRTTFGGSPLSIEDLPMIGELVRGCHRYVIQAFRGGKTLEAGLAGSPSAHTRALKKTAQRLTAAGVPTEVR
jgi:pyruvate formate lyase activating enzyme